MEAIQAERRKQQAQHGLINRITAILVPPSIVTGATRIVFILTNIIAFLLAGFLTITQRRLRFKKPEDVSIQNMSAVAQRGSKTSEESLEDEGSLIIRMSMQGALSDRFTGFSEVPAQEKCLIGIGSWNDDHKFMSNPQTTVDLYPGEDSESDQARSDLGADELATEVSGGHANSRSDTASTQAVQNQPRTRGRQLEDQASWEHTTESMHSPTLDSAQYFVQIRNVSRTVVADWLKSNLVSPASKEEVRTAGHTHANGTHRSTSGISNAIVSGSQRGRRAERSQRNLKRRADGNGEEEGDDDIKERKSRRLNDSDRGEAVLIWACPYWKYDPTKYSLLNNCKCSTYMLDTIPRLK